VATALAIFDIAPGTVRPVFKRLRSATARKRSIQDVLWTICITLMAVGPQVSAFQEAYLPWTRFASWRIDRTRPGQAPDLWLCRQFRSDVNDFSTPRPGQTDDEGRW